MKKITKSFALLTFVSGALSSCTYYSVKPGPMKNVVGIYTLSVYKMKHNEDDDDTYDKKAAIGAKAYFTLDSDGYAYYAYKDNSTSPKFATMFGTFEFDSEKEGYVRSVKLSDGVTSISEQNKYVGCFDEPRMGFRNDLFKKIFHYNLSGYADLKHEKKIPYQYVEYKRVSSDTSLKKLNELLGTNFQVDVPYECKALSGYLVYRCQTNENPSDGKGVYEYAVLDANSYSNGKYIVYYSLKSNPGQKTTEIPVNIEQKGHSFSVMFGEQKFYGGAEYGPLATYLSTRMEDYPAGSQIIEENFTNYWGSELSLAEVIANEKAYNSSI